jgi:hypothetical protein
MTGIRHEPCKDCKVNNVKGFVGRTIITLCTTHEREFKVRHEAAERSCSHFYRLQQEETPG